MMLQNPGVCAVTGASGYVGSIITQALRKNTPVVQLIRNPKNDSEIAWSLESDEDIAPTLRSRNVKTLIHAAWDMRATSFRKLEESCVRGSAVLFGAARRAGVERIIFISTISAFEGCRSSYGKSKLAVEKLLRGGPNVVFRLGLVYGEQQGGVFGGIRTQVQSGSILPIIGRGFAPQYLLHENTLGDAIVSAVRGAFDHTRVTPITLAHPKPWPFRNLVQSIAASEGRKVTLIPIPWQLLFAGLRMGEAVRINLPFRSDSVISFVYYNRDPDFGLMRSLGIKPLPYEPR
jgi:nucleoside-diphosphate-sugar epimerase